ncbi:hypothetical protein BkAM31D_02615 [Halalkalibacter krulwichiae]|uniref:Uncharacterized protein n=1 Tax=Halalkalibacter krulwichiae TaxID=199441 RepID=A0A1X9M9I5_9BACI|nr:hypothetical protein BkAM31D_02615 [Halalkalibacter krulwichiae]
MDYSLSVATWLWIIIPFAGIIGLSILTIIFEKE